MIIREKDLYLYYPDYMYHHGIKGMRWGIRRFQDKSGRRTAAGKKRYAENNGKEQESKGKFKLTDKQKKYIKIGAAAVATAVVAYGAYKVYQNKTGYLTPELRKMRDNLGEKNLEFLRKMDKGKKALKVKGIELDDAIQNQTSKFKELPKNMRSMEQVVKDVNPTKSRDNCYNCVVSAVFRLCGIDVTAKGDTMSGDGLDFDEVCKVFNLNPSNESQVRKIFRGATADMVTRGILRRYKEGDVGAIGFEHNNIYKRLRNINPDKSAAHTLNWIIKNNEVVFLDGQANALGDRIKEHLTRFLSGDHEVKYARFANIIDGLDMDNGFNKDIIDRFINK